MLFRSYITYLKTQYVVVYLKKLKNKEKVNQIGFDSTISF